MAIGNSLRLGDFESIGEAQVKTVSVDFDGPLPRPTRNLETARSDLNGAGYAILADMMTRDQLRETREALIHEIAREEAIDENRVSKFYVDPDAKNRRLFQLPARHRFFRSLLEHPVVLDLTRYLLGPTLLNESYLVHSFDANLTRPGSGAQLIHRDRTLAFFEISRALQSRFIWCLDPFDEENGATRVVPGSHRWNEPVDMTGATYYESVPAEAPAGSLIFYSDLLLHGTGANVSPDRERASLNGGYCPPWCRPMVNYPLVIDPKDMEGESRTLRQLLGYSSVCVGNDEIWLSATTEMRDLCVPAAMEY